MNILIIKLSPIEAVTSSMFRTLALARGLEEAGNHVDYLVIPFNSVLSKGREYDFMNNFRVIRTNQSAAYNNIINGTSKGLSSLKKICKDILRNLWHKFSVYDYTYTIARNISADILPLKHYDIVISSSDPKSSHIAVKRLKKQGLTYNKWIQYWGDPLAIDITQKSIYPRFILKKIEKGLLAGADKIVYVSPFTLKEQQKIFPTYKSKMCFYPVAYMNEEIFPDTKNERFIIGYYGNYSSKVRNLLPLYEACKELEEADTTIYGDSNLRLINTTNVHILPRGIADEHKKIADLLICVMNSSGTQIPGKLYHLAGTNKKILIVLDGEYTEDMASYLKLFNRFYLCNNNKDDIQVAIKNIMLDNRTFSPVRELKYNYIAKEFIR